LVHGFANLALFHQALCQMLARVDGLRVQLDEKPVLLTGFPNLSLLFKQPCGCLISLQPLRIKGYRLPVGCYGIVVFAVLLS
jgi:hypothetical protein